jgi:glycosyltransferase involved in cell wall biosynthesis
VRLAVGRGSVLFLHGWCWSSHREKKICELRLRIGGDARQALAWGMPRPDVRRTHADRRSLHSGFWGMVPLLPRDVDVCVDASLVAAFTDGTEGFAALGEIELSSGPPIPLEPSSSVLDDGHIAICMATFNPRIDLFARQVESIRAQTHAAWTCTISDDGSDPGRLEEMRAVLAGDARFALHTSERRRGFYRNFERTLTLAPAEAGLLAFCDQDDRWYPEKLEVLAGSLGSADLVYSDQRIVDPRGQVIAAGYWTHRRNNHTDLASLLVANTVTGAASLFRRELLARALPFPAAPGSPYHDHWLALVALAGGKIAYVDRPLYDYVQHEGATLGHARANRVKTEVGTSDGSPRRRFRPGWRGGYFFDYCRLRVFAQVLDLRYGNALAGTKRRALAHFLSPDTSPLVFSWLLLRSVRVLWGGNETLGAERGLAGSLAWRRLVGFGGRLPLVSLAFNARLPFRGEAR